MIICDYCGNKNTCLRFSEKKDLPENAFDCGDFLEMDVFRLCLCGSGIPWVFCHECID